ncbi:MAG: PspC domain-containing protein [Actinomycetaceae bacterium]|nr:PspC domain-containing protein [Actinomycetaceae bacterium]
MSVRLHRSASDRFLGGVCGGIAATYGWDSGLVRLVVVLLALLPGPMWLAYLVLWVVLPRSLSRQ